MKKKNNGGRPTNKEKDIQKRLEEERAARQVLEQKLMELQKVKTATSHPPCTPVSNVQPVPSPHVTVQKHTENIMHTTPQSTLSTNVTGINAQRYVEFSNFAQQLALADQNAALVRQNLILQNALLGNNNSN